MIPRRWRIFLQLRSLMKPVFSNTSKHGLTNTADSGSRPLRFVVFARQRSGSTWLADLLNSHPRTRTFAELLQYDSWGHPAVGGDIDIPFWNSWRALHGRPTGRRDLFQKYFRYLDDVVYCPRPGIEAVGFKLMYNQLNSAFAIPAYIQSRNVYLVHLVRNNLLDCILSIEAVSKRSVALARAGAEVAKVSIHLEGHSLIERLEDREAEIEQGRRVVRWLRVPAIEIAYEDLEQNLTSLTKVIRFLELDDAEITLQSDMVKLNPRDHRQIIANYDEVQAVLDGTRFAWMLR